MGTLHRCIEERRYSQFAFLANHHSATVNARDERGRTPLHRCCSLANDDGWAVNCARTLLQLGAEPGAVDLEARTPLHYACKNGNLPMTRTLLQLNPDICVDSSDQDANTPLHYAAARGDPRLLGLLIARYRRFDLDVDRQNLVGFTPLQLAAANGHLDIARSLVAAGASMTSRDGVFFKNAGEWLAAHFCESELPSSPASGAAHIDDGRRQRRLPEETRVIVARWRADRQADFDFSRLPLEDAWIRGIGGGEPLFLAFRPSSLSPRRQRHTAASGSQPGGWSASATSAANVLARTLVATRQRRSLEVPPQAAAALSGRCDSSGLAAVGASDVSSQTSLQRRWDAYSPDPVSGTKKNEDTAASSRTSSDCGGGGGGGALPLPTSWSMLRSITEVLLEQLSDSYRPPPAQRAKGDIEQQEQPLDDDGVVAITTALQATSRRA